MLMVFYYKNYNFLIYLYIYYMHIWLSQNELNS